MKSHHFSSALCSILLFAATSPASATVTPYGLDEYQTVDTNGTFPAAGSNNIDKFDTAGTAHNAVAPFTTTVYVRSSASGTAGNLPRRTQLFLQFDLAALTANTINSATLEFSAYSLNDKSALGTDDPDLFISQLANDWAPGGTPDPTYNPATIGSSINAGSIVSGTQTDIYDSGLTLTGSPVYRNTTAYSIDVTSIVQNWQSGDPNHGFHLELGDTISQNQGLGIDPATLVLNVEEFSPNPSASLSTASAAVSAAYTVDITFNKDVTGLADTDFNVTNGTASALTGSGANYSVLITPTAAGDVHVTLPADSANATVGGLGNLASNTLVTAYSLPTPPSVTLSSSNSTVPAPYTIDVTFSGDVTGLEDSDFTVTNGVASGVAGLNDIYTVLITPTAPGNVTVELPASSVTDVDTGLGNLLSNSLVTNFDPTAYALINFLNGDLDTDVPVDFGTSAGAPPWTFDPLTNEVLYNFNPADPGANQWVWSDLSRGFEYNADGGAGGVSDGAFVQSAADDFNQKPRAVLYFADDNKLTTGPLDFGIDVFFQDNTVDNALQFLVELYAWNDSDLSPLLSAGGGTGNDPTYNLTDLGDSITILNTQVLATSVTSSTWTTIPLGSADVGTGFDNYAWRIGVMGATPTDTFAFDNVTVTSGTLTPTITVTAINRAANGDTTINFTSNTGNADVYRSTDLQTWGTAIDSNVAPGTYLDNTAAALPEAFYVLVPTGVSFP